ncbi:MAG: ATP-binding protein [Bacteroidales bacterium]|nr:ATP-binding protein [Bacteroidales bacterium]
MVNKDILEEVLKQNRELVENMRVVKRDFLFYDHFRYVLVGVRRAGKSFLLFQRMQELLREGHSWDEMLYLNFEDDRLLGFNVHDFDTILEVHTEMGGSRPMLFLDEIQNIEGWEKFARRLADQKFMVYITGSNAKMLSSDVATTLGGRYVVENVFPYSFPEFAKANLFDTEKKQYDFDELEPLVDDYLRHGGFPECAPLQGKKEYLLSVYQKIYLGDIALRNKVENQNALRLMFRRLAECVNQPVALTRLANLMASVGTKVSKNTIISYANYAKDAFLILPMKNWADNFTMRETNQKYYFVDNGIIGLLTTDCLTSQLENMVAVALLRKYGLNDSVFFYNYNVEVDFVVPEKALAVQVCYTLGEDGSETFMRETQALIKLNKRLSFDNLMVLTYNDDFRQIEVGNDCITIMPVWKWMMEM